MIQIGLLLDGEEHFPFLMEDGSDAPSTEFCLTIGDSYQFPLVFDVSEDGNIVIKDGEQIFDLGTDGIFDWKLIDLEPSLLIAETRTGPMKIIFSTILKPNGSLSASIEHTQAPLYLRHNLKWEAEASGDTESFLTLRQVLTGREQVAVITSNSASLTQAVLTFIADWSDYRMEDLKDLTIDQMIYKEVGA